MQQIISKNDKLLSDLIRFLRFPLTVGVVYIHFNIATNGKALLGDNLIDYSDWYYWLINFFSDVLPRIGVPIFFFFSGFLFFYKKEFSLSLYANKLQVRIRTLVIPYLLWNTIAILLVLSHKLPFLSSVFPNANTWDVNITFERLFHTYFANYTNDGIFVSHVIDSLATTSQNPYPIDLPLWYVRDLMVMIILSPIIYILIKKIRIWIVLLFGVLWFLYVPVCYPDGGWGTLLCSAVFFFSWGGYYSINKINFVETMRTYKCLPFIYIPLAIVDVYTKNSSFNIFIHNSGIIIGIISVIVVVAYLLESRRIRVSDTLSKSSFFVFALHSLIMVYIGRLIYHFLILLKIHNSVFSMLSLFFVTPILTTIICVLTYVLLKKCIPSVCNLLTGGR